MVVIESSLYRTRCINTIQCSLSYRHNSLRSNLPRSVLDRRAPSHLSMGSDCSPAAFPIVEPRKTKAKAPGRERNRSRPRWVSRSTMGSRLSWRSRLPMLMPGSVNVSQLFNYAHHDIEVSLTIEMSSTRKHVIIVVYSRRSEWRDVHFLFYYL